MENTIDDKYCLLSVIGSHAGESMNALFERKIKDTINAGMTFWLIKSFAAKPFIVQSICSEAINYGQKSIQCYFITASTPGGAVPTKTSIKATKYSSNNKDWQELPQISPVTGAIDISAYALVFRSISPCYIPIDLAQYASYLKPSNPVRIQQGASTICAIKKDMRDNPNVMKSSLRTMVAIGILESPFCVWLK